MARLTPVVPQDDPHDKEIKAFFAATPSGKVELAIAGDQAPLDASPGEQFYVNLVPADKTNGGTLFWLVKVTSLGLNWATQVKLSAERETSAPWQPCEMEFSVNNEYAAEQFQMGRAFYVTLERVVRDA
jgi:hypothetical protein